MRCSVSHTCNAEVSCACEPRQPRYWCQLDHNCDQQTSTTTNTVADTMYYSTSAPSWKWTNVANGHKFLAIRRLNQWLPSQPVEKRNFYLATCICRPHWRVIPSEFRKNILHHKTRVLGYHVALLRLALMQRQLIDTSAASARRISHICLLWFSRQHSW